MNDQTQPLTANTVESLGLEPTVWNRVMVAIVASGSFDVGAGFSMAVDLLLLHPEWLMAVAATRTRRPGDKARAGADWLVEHFPIESRDSYEEDADHESA